MFEAASPEPMTPVAPADVSEPYTRRQRWYIASAVSVLVAIMVGISFAAGVYIGDNREVAIGAIPGGPAGPAPGQAPQRFGQPQAGGGAVQGQGAAPAPGVIPGAAAGGGATNADVAGRPYDLIAGVSAVSGNMLQVNTPDGPREYRFDPATRVLSDTGQQLTRAALRPATVVGILLRPNAGVIDSVTVISGQRVPGPPQQVPAN